VKIRLGVKQLVDFACRSGDLVLDGLAGPTAKEGQVIHRRLQNAHADTHQSEISLKVEIPLPGKPAKDNPEGEVNSPRIVQLSGRADLLKRSDDSPEIIEIKSTYVPPDRVAGSTMQSHWAQLKIYGALLWLLDNDSVAAARPLTELVQNPPSEGWQTARLQLAIHNILEDKTYRENQEFPVADLLRFTCDALVRYLDWYEAVETRKISMRETAGAMDFPFGTFRTGQYRMAATSYVTIKRGEKLLCEAPTGTGKTISTLFPACKALAEGHVSQVVYLTAKTSGREAAFSAIGKLEEAGLHATSLVVHSKALACHCQNGRCERNDDGRCPLTIGFFDRLPDARYELLEAGRLDPETIDEAALKHSLCPFELSLQMLPWVDLVVCDYNYVFDPLVRLTTFIERSRELALLIDEAHNLADRARNMYSAELTYEENLKVAQDCKKMRPDIARAASGLNRAIARYVKGQTNSHQADAVKGMSVCSGLSAGEIASTEKPDTVTRAVEKCLDALSMPDSPDAPGRNKDVSGDLFDAPEAHAQNAPGGNIPDSVRDWFKTLFRYRVIEELFTEQHRTLVDSSQHSTGGTGHDNLKLACLDASQYLSSSFTSVNAAVVFSATLRPQEYFVKTLGLEGHAKALSLPSPFEQKNMACLVCNWIDPRFNERRNSAADLVELIYQVYSVRAGNYLVFFPSYSYMEDIHDRFKAAYPDLPLVQQSRAGVSDSERFLSHFKPGCASLGFAIMGGLFGEGIDLPGEHLVGAIVVGTGLPAPVMEQNLLSDHFRSQSVDGYDYAFRYPGFTRVQQTAGRVIRGETDHGVVLLVDPRFDTNFYRALFPEHWAPVTCANLDEASSNLEAFWSSAEKGLQLEELVES